jgi:hypothetical protein
MVGRVGSLFVLVLTAATAHAQPGRTVAGKSASPAAAFAARPDGGAAFKVLPANADLHAGELLVALPGAALESKDGSIAVRSLADYDGRSPLPILETAFTLHDPKEKGTDLELKLDRGRVDLTNKKSDGAATVRVIHRDQAWTIRLNEPGARVALECYGRWPSGSRFRLVDPDGNEKPAEPVASLVLLVLRGSAVVDIGGASVGMKAPPGPAVLEWDSSEGTRPQPKKLDTLPKWADPAAELGTDGKKLAAAVEKFRAARAEMPEEAIKRFLASPDPVEQRVALVTLGALDDLVGLGEALIAAKSLDQWDFGITVLRHWLGRGPGQDQRFYKNLTTARGYTPVQARIVMRLLFGFSTDELKVPETYEVLIDYLTHEKPGIRNLAAWHLVRLVPQGKSIPYKPDGTADEAVKAQQAWRKLVPAGELPPAPRK